MFLDGDIQSQLLLLESTEDGKARNALALRLAEARAPGLDQVLVRLIKRSDLADNRGTLVHALAYYGCSPHVGLLVELVVSGNFEVAHEALYGIETIDHVKGSEVENAFEMLKGALAADGVEDWRRPLLGDLWDMFD